MSQEEGTQALQGGARRWVETLQHLAEQIQRQQQVSLQMTEALMDTYMQLLNIQSSYAAQLPQQQQQRHNYFQQLAQQWMQQFQQQSQQQQQVFQQMVQQTMGAYTQMFAFPASQAQEGAQIAQRATPSEVPIEGYDELSVKEIVARLEGLSGEELGRVRQYESRNKNRTTLLEQLDRKAGGAS